LPSSSSFSLLSFFCRQMRAKFSLAAPFSCYLPFIPPSFLMLLLSHCLVFLSLFSLYLPFPSYPTLP
jgi:hypothetical protein